MSPRAFLLTLLVAIALCLTNAVVVEPSVDTGEGEAEPVVAAPRKLTTWRTTTRTRIPMERERPSSCKASFAACRKNKECCSGTYVSECLFLWAQFRQ
jgi:hypothetical protein